MGISINIFPYGMYEENTYIITDDDTGYKAVIDPGYYSNAVREIIGDVSSLKYILLTHGHQDHMSELDTYIKEYPEALFAAPETELAIIKTDHAPDLLLHDANTIDLGETRIKVIATPGHTGGGVCYVTDKEVFSGDTLFKLSVGRTDLPTGDWDTLVSSIKHKLYTLDDAYEVYPGHGPATSIGYEKKANPFV